MKLTTSAITTATLSLLGSGHVARAAVNPEAAFRLEATGIDGPSNASISAALDNLWLDFPNQNADCLGRGKEYALFQIQGDMLFLHETPMVLQQVYTDRSGFGRGKIGYRPYNPRIPPRFEVNGWYLDDGDNLSFQGDGLLACPHGFEEAWSIWADVLNDAPNGIKGCVPFKAHAVQESNPVPCYYSSPE